MIIMNAIKEARIIRGLTQKQLATLIGCSTCHLYKLETNRAIPSRKLALVLAKTLHLDLVEILYPDITLYSDAVSD